MLGLRVVEQGGALEGRGGKVRILLAVSGLGGGEVCNGCMLGLCEAACDAFFISGPSLVASCRVSPTLLGLSVVWHLPECLP